MKANALLWIPSWLMKEALSSVYSNDRTYSAIIAILYRFPPREPARSSVSFRQAITIWGYLDVIPDYRVGNIRKTLILKAFVHIVNEILTKLS